MATVTEIQDQLDPQGLGTRIRLIRRFRVSTTDTWYALGGVDARGQAKWVTSDNTDSATDQATDITTAMTA